MCWARPIEYVFGYLSTVNHNGIAQPEQMKINVLKTWSKSDTLRKWPLMRRAKKQCQRICDTS